MVGAPGGVKRPPLWEDAPWRATSVPISRWFGSVGSTAMVAIPRSFDAATDPASNVHVVPPSVDLYTPTPASLSLEPFGSPVPT